MFEKSLIKILKSLSAVIYVIIMLALFAFPVSFIVHAFLPPEFNLNSIYFEQLSESTEAPSENGYRVDYNVTASAGRYSPYEYTIEAIALTDDEFLSFAEGYEVVIDETSYFTKDIHDEIIISLYIYTDENIDIESLCTKAQFKTKIYEKGFREFKIKYGEDKSENTI